MDALTLILIAAGAGAAGGVVLQAWRVARANGTGTLKVIVTPNLAGGNGDTP